MIIFVINNNHVTNFNYIALRAPGRDAFMHRVGCKSAKHEKNISTVLLFFRYPIDMNMISRILITYHPYRL